MRLSEHFTLREFTVSQTATRKGINNTPGVSDIANIKRLCVDILEPIRERFGPVIITSGYRCRELNRAIGGSTSSAHCSGRAADFELTRYDLDDAFQWIKNSKLNFDQAINEYPPTGWIHVAIAEANQTARNQTLLAERVDGRTRYKVV